MAERELGRQRQTTPPPDLSFTRLSCGQHVIWGDPWSVIRDPCFTTSHSRDSGEMSFDFEGHFYGGKL